MKNQINKKNQMKSYLFFNMDSHKTINSLKTFSKIFLIFSLAFIAGYIYKISNIDLEKTTSFRLILSDTDILPLYKNDMKNFIFISIYEMLRMILLTSILWYFYKFLASVNIADPFENIISKIHINRVANLSTVFFFIDFVGSMHLKYISNELGIDVYITTFNFEYLFIVYFISVFSVIFSRGIDLKNEIDLVI